MLKINIILLLGSFLSFSSFATDTPPVNTSGTDNVPSSGNQGCNSMPSNCQVKL